MHLETSSQATNASTATEPKLKSTSGYLDMLPVAISNAVLVIVTFNVYIFWAKTNVREYLWRTTILDGRPLSYTGSGLVLARGFLSTAALFLLFFGYPALIVINALEVDQQALSLPDLGLLGSLLVAAIVPVLISAVTFILVVAPEVETTPTSIAVSITVLYLGIVAVVILSRFLTYRYLFRHTSWRDNAGQVIGSPWRYTARMLLPELSTGLTLGWSSPWCFMRRYALLLENATFCGAKVTFENRSAPLYGPYAITWISIAVLAITTNTFANRLDAENPAFPLQLTLLLSAFAVTVVLALAYYNAKLFAHVADSMRVAGVELRFDARWWQLVLLYLTNLAMNLLSVGVSYYYSRMRIARFIARHLKVDGSLLSLQGPGADPSREGLGEGVEILAGGSYF